MKDKREIRPIGWWFLIFFGAALLLIASFSLDPVAQTWVKEHQGAAGRSFFKALSRYGDWPEHVALGLICLGLAWLRGSKRWRRIFLTMVLACALAGVAARVVKISTGRARPNVQVESGWNGPRLSARYNSFPSGHTAASTAFFATLVFAGWRIGFGLMLIPGLIAFSRMYVAAHYLSDVVCGAIIGLVAAWCIAQRFSPAIENRNLETSAITQRR